MISQGTLTAPRKPWYFSLIDRTSRPRYDIFPIFADPKAFDDLITDITSHFANVEYNKVIGLDAIGFILAGALAYKSQKPFIPIRKSGKLPHEDLEKREIQDWDGKKGLEIKRTWINNGDKILLVDEWVGEGFQLRAAIEIVEALGGVVAGIACVYIHPDFEGNIKMINSYETFTANCLVCKYFECRCEKGS